MEAGEHQDGDVIKESMSDVEDDKDDIEKVSGYDGRVQTGCWAAICGTRRRLPPPPAGTPCRYLLLLPHSW